VSEHVGWAVVGGGILGLAHACELAKRGRRVSVFERGARATGASVRNFGMLWPIGQPPGTMYRLASRSLELWQEVLRASGIWHERTGSLHLAYQDDEAQVLREFAAEAKGTGVSCHFLAPSEVLERTQAVKPDGLRAGLWSPMETCVDPPEVIGELPRWLASEHGVRFHFGCAATAYEPGRLRAGGQEWQVERLFVCSGDDFETLFPDALGANGLVRCKLQMMRSAPYGSRRKLGPMLAGGLTLRHYQAFHKCPSLPALIARVAAEMPEYDRYGIHVMAAQNRAGEIVIGDSHEYGPAVEPFDKTVIDELILVYLATFLDMPDLEIAARWHGTYAKHPSEPYLVIHPAPGATVITGVGGAGMTLSFGLAEQVVRDELEA
jgi:FAD dependent oxidoreductase TIGR03364